MDSIADVAQAEAPSSGSGSGLNLDAYYLRRPDAELNQKG
jgi:hypothetical protein